VTRHFCSSPTVNRASCNKPTLQRWLRFNLVGGIGIGVQLGTLFLLKTDLHLNYRAATAIAVELTVLHNFLWHERYTWSEHVRTSWRYSMTRLIRFNLTNGAVSVVGNLALMEVTVDFLHMNYMATNAVAIVFCSLLNFLVSDNYVFGENKQATD
jgi:putative flippase GtrA